MRKEAIKKENHLSLCQLGTIAAGLLLCCVVLRPVTAAALPGACPPRPCPAQAQTGPDCRAQSAGPTAPPICLHHLWRCQGARGPILYLPPLPRLPWPRSPCKQARLGWPPEWPRGSGEGLALAEAVSGLQAPPPSAITGPQAAEMRHKP